MTATRDPMEFKNADTWQNAPHGVDVTQWDGTTIGKTSTSINLITLGTDHVGYVRGVNWIDLAGIESVDLLIDGAVARHWDKHNTPHAAADMADLDTFRPPLRAVTSIDLQMTGTSTIRPKETVIVAYEATE